MPQHHDDTCDVLAAQAAFGCSGLQFYRSGFRAEIWWREF